MLIIKTEVRKRQNFVDQPFVVRLRFTKDRVVKRITTGLYATEDDLTKNLEFKENASIKYKVELLIEQYMQTYLRQNMDREKSNESIDFIIHKIIGWYYITL